MSIRPLLNSFAAGTTEASAARARRAGRRTCGQGLVEELEGRRLLSFSPAATYPVGYAATAATGDFNADGQADLSMASGVLFGRAGGTFGPATYPAVGGQSKAAVVGDFNNDGKHDLASVLSDSVSVALGDGAGGFAAPAITPAGMTTTSTVAGDVNGDGKLDLVTSGYTTWARCSPGYGGYYCSGGQATMVSVMIGRGDGTFSIPGGTKSMNDSYPSAAAESTAALADFNGDGKLDLVHALGDSGSPFAILIGNGDGSFADPRPVGTGYAKGVAVGDLDGDGKQDVVTAGSWTGAVSIHRGKGDGTFLAAWESGAVAADGAVTLADLNGDGKLDVVTATGGVLSVSPGKGDGTLRLPMQFGIRGTSSGGLVADDFNRDGRPDVAVRAGDADGDRAAVLLNDGAWPAADAPAIRIGDVTVTEGNTGTVTAAFTVSLSAAATQPVTVSYATADATATAGGGDYQAKSGTLTFAAGETSKVVHVSVNGDRLAESGESFSVLLSGASASAFVADDRSVGTIMDDEPTVSMDGHAFDYRAAEGNAGTMGFTFTVTLSAAYDAPVTVRYATADPVLDEQYWYDYADYWYDPAATPGDDYAAASGSVTFAAGETRKTITVLVNGDRLAESTEHFAVNLIDSAAAHIGFARALGTIVDDEPRVSVTGGSVTEGHSGARGLAFTVTLSNATDVPVTVDYATADGTATAGGGDYQAKSGTLTFAPGQTSQTVTVAVNGDRLGEQDETFSVNLAGATNAGVSSSVGSGTILDDEPRINVNSVRLTEGNSGTRVMTFTATLSAATDAVVSVNYATSDYYSATAGNDYVAAAGTLTFAAGQTSKTFTVTIRGDKKREADEYFYVMLSGVSANAVAGQSGVGTILNDDFR